MKKKISTNIRFLIDFIRTHQHIAYRKNRPNRHFWTCTPRKHTHSHGEKCNEESFVFYNVKWVRCRPTRVLLPAALVTPLQRESSLPSLKVNLKKELRLWASDVGEISPFWIWRKERENRRSFPEENFRFCVGKLFGLVWICLVWLINY